MGSSTEVLQPTDRDILIGKRSCVTVKGHPGNGVFRCLVQKYTAAYSAGDLSLSDIRDAILKETRGRFLTVREGEEPEIHFSPANGNVILDHLSKTLRKQELRRNKMTPSRVTVDLVFASHIQKCYFRTVPQVEEEEVDDGNDADVESPFDSTSSLEEMATIAEEGLVHVTDCEEPQQQPSDEQLQHQQQKQPSSDDKDAFFSKLSSVLSEYCESWPASVGSIHERMQLEKSQNEEDEETTTTGGNWCVGLIM